MTRLVRSVLATLALAAMSYAAAARFSPGEGPEPMPTYPLVHVQG